MTHPVVAVCGLRTEARIVRGPGVVVVAGGGNIAFLTAGIERAVADGASAIVSFGIAGGLAPDLEAGTLFVGDAVVTTERRYATDVAWSARLAVATGARRGIIASGDRIVATVDDKRRLHEATGAIAVDTESHVAARLAETHGLPFAVLRAIADPAERALPHVALVAMKAGGGIDLAAVVRSLIARPRQLSVLMAVARDSRAALDRLRDGRSRLAQGSRLGLDDLDLG